MITDSSETNPFQLGNDVKARQKYTMMLKMGVPIGAVRQAMTIHGHVPVHSFRRASRRQIPANLDPEYKKYAKMLKFGLPIEAVMQKMRLDGRGKDADNLYWWNEM